MISHKGTQTLETKRLILRRANTVDTQPMFDNWASDPQVTKYLTWPTHPNSDITKMVIDSWIEGYEKEDNYQWMIVLKSINQPIGTISVIAHSDRVAKAEIGYCIGRKWWHMGITTEALKTVIEFLFFEVGMRRVEARHDISNPHSGDVMKKCGMKYEGTFRQAGINNQGICDVACYGILRSDLDEK